MSKSAKINRVELMQKIKQIIDMHSNDPVEEIAALGQALLDISKALEGQSSADAKAILAAVFALEGQ